MIDDIIDALSIGYSIIVIIGVARILWLIDPVLGMGYIAILIMSIIAGGIFILPILFANKKIKSKKSKGGHF